MRIHGGIRSGAGTVNRARRVILLMMVTALAAPVSGYERSTHRALSTAAVSSSRLGTKDTLLPALGLPPFSTAPTLPNSNGVPKAITLLVGDGVDREDDLFPRIRVMHHFYDPVHSGEPLNPCVALCLPPFCGAPFSECHASPDWALEDTSDISDQEFSFAEARKRLHEALTDTTDRAVKFGKMFETLGHVIHHLQDMAQPQHVRNDPHGIEARYEHYVKLRGEEGPPVSFTGYAPVTFDFTQRTARAFWASGQSGIGEGIAEFTSRNFVSTDTNLTASPAGLVPTPAEIGPNSRYPFPNGQGATVTIEDWSTLITDRPPPQNPFLQPSALDGKVVFVRTPVVDYLTGQQEVNPRTSSWGIYDPDLTGLNVPVDCKPVDPDNPCQTKAIFTLNDFNFDQAQKRLLPRAVGYSAGLIDYFFRTIINADGSPVLRLTSTDLGTGTGTLRVANTSAEDMVGGTLELFYDNRTSGLRESAGSVSLSVPAGGDVTIAEGGAINFAQLRENGPINGAVVVVYRGPMGAETDAVAARVCDCPAKPIADPDDPARDCRGLCPCEYVGLEEGNAAGEPGVPGDGATVPVSLFVYQVPVFDDDGNFIGFENRSDSYVTLDRSVSAVSQRQYPDGFTVTVFAAPGAPAPSRPYVVEFLRRDEAYTNGVDTENPKGNTSVSGATGSFVSVSRPAIDDLNAGMSPTDPFYYDLVAEVDLCQICGHQPVDAIALCPGMGMSPTD